MARRVNFLPSYFLMGCCVGLGLLVNPSYASFPLTPRVSALALASDYTVGQADLMLPIQGNASQNLYVNPALSYGTDNQNEFDVGLGYRWISNQAAILGGYLFGGYSRLDNNARVWIANPGIEALGSRWDAHLNAYFPMGDRHYVAGTDIVHFFTGHSEFGSVFLIDQYVGSGADAKVGYQLFPNSSLKGYVGSYYFSPVGGEVNNVWGGAAGLEYWLTQGVKLIGSYTYDNLHHSTYAFGIGLEWGGTRAHRADPALDERLTDPVERYLAELGHGSTIPSRIKYQHLLTGTGGALTDTIIVFANNIAFFSRTGRPNNGGAALTSANCTFENPCGLTDFSQASVNTLGGLLPNTEFYFNGGTYTSNGTVNLAPGQSLHSRTADYSQPATDTARSTIVSNTISLQGNNTLENIILLPINPSTTGVVVSGANNMITGSQIGFSSNRFSLGVLDLGNTLISNSEIFSSRTAYQATTGQTSSVIEDSVLDVSDSSNTDVSGIVIIGRNGNVTINHTEIRVIQLAGNTGTLTYGLDVQNQFNTVNLNNSTITVTSVFGTYAIRNFNSTVVVNGDSLNVNSTNGPVAIVDPGFNAVTIGGTVCHVNGSVVVC